MNKILSIFKRIPILDRYLIGQFVTTFLFILGMVISICVLVDFVEKVDEFLDKKPPMSEILFDYYLNFIPYWGNLLSPICIFLAVIFFTSRMASRTEIIPMYGAGITFGRVLIPYIITGIMLAGVSYYFKSHLIPKATEERIEFEYKYLRKPRLSRKRDVHKKVAPDTFVYIGYYNEKKKEGHTFGLERIKDGDILAKIDAKRIRWVDSTRSWKLSNVVARYITDLKEEVVMHRSLDTTFLLTPDDIYVKEQKAESMSLPELLEYIKWEEMRGSDILRELYIERHRRFSDPFSIIILTLIGFAMSSRKSRGGIALQIGLGLLICFLYIALLFAGQALISDTFPAWAAVWLPNIIFLPISIILLYLAPK
ncbi:MAG: LptF/LptG family permease [Bacteroidota bacterium]